MPFLATRPVRLQPYFGYRSAARLRLSARALRQRASTFASQPRLRAVHTMISQFASHESGGVEVKLMLRGKSGALLLEHKQTTDSEGFVHFDVALGAGWDLPEQPMWEVAELSWKNSNGPQTVEARVLAPGANSDLGVISDIDDTIIETGITGGIGSVIRNWKRLLAQMPDERIAVAGASEFYSAMGGVPVARDERDAPAFTAQHRPFFYVSSSPWNLFSYLVAFKRSKNLPLGPIALRDWGLNTKTLGHSSHGSHKRTAIDAILGTYPDMRFALIGDDTQGDLPAFADVVAAHGPRIAAVFVRRVSKDPLSADELSAQKTIKQAKVPLWIGESYRAGMEFVQWLDPQPDDETAQIVKAVSKPAEPV